MKYEDYFKEHLRLIQKALEKTLPEAKQYPSVIHEAMRHAVLTGGKRFRPVLTLTVCEACGAKADHAVIPAVAVELIHAYSLVHDDLPALDNDNFRRGKPTVHRQFGEALAVLAGDGLLTLAFQVLSRFQPADRASELLAEISTAAGTYGMIGGQVADLVSQRPDLDLPTVDYINVHKTGKLIKASAVSGAIAAGADRRTRHKIMKYGECLGLAFQAIDDLLDGDGYLFVMHPNDVGRRVRDLIAKAKRVIRPLGEKSQGLQKLSDFLLLRMPKEMNAHAAMDS